MKEVRADVMRELEGSARGIAQVIDRILNPGKPKEVGFALFVFSFEGAEMTYISNAQRADMVDALKAFLAKQESIPEKPWDKHTR